MISTLYLHADDGGEEPGLVQYVPFPEDVPRIRAVKMGVRSVVGELFPGGVWDTRLVGGTVLVVEENEDEEGKDVKGVSGGGDDDITSGSGNDGNGDEKRTTVTHDFLGVGIGIIIYRIINVW